MPQDSLVMLEKDVNKIKFSPAREIKHLFWKKKIFFASDPPTLQMCSTKSSKTEVTTPILYYEAQKGFNRFKS